LRVDQVFRFAGGKKNADGQYAGYVLFDLPSGNGQIAVTLDGTTPKCPAKGGSPSSVRIFSMFAFENICRLYPAKLHED
jgi:hypothetical protein